MTTIYLRSAAQTDLSAGGYASFGYVDVPVGDYTPPDGYYLEYTVNMAAALAATASTPGGGGYYDPALELSIFAKEITRSGEHLKYILDIRGYFGNSIDEATELQAFCKISGDGGFDVSQIIGGGCGYVQYSSNAVPSGIVYLQAATVLVETDVEDDVTFTLHVIHNGGASPEPNFWTSFIGSREII